MATGELALTEYHKPQTAIEIRAHVNLIQEVMRAVMKENTHYGVIPGCQKPSLWKPGAEVLFATFRVSVDPVVEDLSGPEEARFRVTAYGSSSSGMRLGSSVGEASSDEEKYKWREVVCAEEWDATTEDHRRTKWKRGKQGPWSVQQIRTNIADCRNTVLKMAVKRAIVALALQVTAASDIFTQDIEDVPEEARESVTEDAGQEQLPTEIKRKPVQAAQSSGAGSDASTPVSTSARTNATHETGNRRPAPEPTQRQSPPVHSPQPQREQTISEAQGRRFFAIWKGSGKTKEEIDHYLREEHKIQSDREITARRYEEACTWAQRASGGKW